MEGLVSREPTPSSLLRKLLIQKIPNCGSFGTFLGRSEDFLRAFKDFLKTFRNFLKDFLRTFRGLSADFLETF